MNDPASFNTEKRQASEKGYVLRPKYENKFTLRKVQPLLRDALIDELSNVERYDPEKADQLAASVMRAVRKRLKESDMSAYKFVVQCVVFERCGQGVEYGASVLWDSDTDCCARQTFHSDMFTCVVTAFGIFYY
uniref:Dynein light chain n=1 Tax=Trichuris muris TaxID=70415 RepID=A0A5S6R1P6_TRIMR